MRGRSTKRKEISADQTYLSKKRESMIDDFSAKEKGFLFGYSCALPELGGM